MGEQIVTVESIQARARKAFAAGQDLSDNPFPWNSKAYITWEREWSRMAGARAHHSQHGIVSSDQAAPLDIPQGGI